MKFISYIKDKHFSILIYIAQVLLIGIMLNSFKVEFFLIILIILLNIITGLIILIYNYLRKSSFYKELINNMNKLDKKYYILETIPTSNTYEEQIMVNVLYDINKSMIENIKKIENNIINYKEFVEIWIHEVKIPISSLVLKIHNNKSKYSNDILSIIRKIDNYIDEILYYIRSEETEYDFIISEVNIKDIIKNIALKNKDDLLMNNITLNVNIEELKVNTDSKWLEYIINQIINNSIKYKKKNDSIIKITTREENKKVILEIYDNGIGIPEKDIKNVCNKSFTGTNGREKIKSTGMGLYIVNNLIKKLGHKLLIESEENIYTKVSIIFNNNDYYKM